MGIIRTSAMAQHSGREFEPVPEGIYQAVLCDVVDLGYIEKVFDGRSQGYKPHLQLVFQTDELREEDGKPYLIFGRRDVLSFHERANFYKTLVQLLGRKRVEELMAMPEWSTETLIGVNCRMQVVHNQGKNGQTYANIAAMFPWSEAKDGPLLEVRDYERRSLRSSWVDPVPSAYDDPRQAQAVIERREAALESAHQSAPITPVPAYPYPDAATAPAAPQPPAAPEQPQYPPMTPEQTAELMTLCQRVYGAGGVAEVEALSQKLFKKSWTAANSDECARMLHEMRNVKPASAVEQKLLKPEPVGGEEVWMSAPYCPFSEEGEPGWRPDGHPDIEADKQAGQQELVTAGPEKSAYPAN